MKWVVSAAVLALGLLAQAVSAQALPFEPGERLTLSVSYLRMGIGNVDIQVNQDVQSGVRVWPLEMQARTSGFFNHVHSINDRFVANFDPVTLRTLSTEFEQHESNQEATESTRFDGSAAYIHRVTKGGPRDRVATVQPGTLDILSAIYYLRSQNFQGSSPVRVPIITGTKNWELIATVAGTEKVRTEAGEFDTMVIRCETHFNGEFSSGREMKVWLSNDERRVPVKIEAGYLVGTMRAELKSYRHGPLAER